MRSNEAINYCVLLLADPCRQSLHVPGCIVYKLLTAAAFLWPYILAWINTAEYLCQPKHCKTYSDPWHHLHVNWRCWCWTKKRICSRLPMRHRTSATTATVCSLSVICTVLNCTSNELNLILPPFTVSVLIWYIGANLCGFALWLIAVVNMAPVILCLQIICDVL